MGKGPYKSRIDRYKNLTTEQKKMQQARQRRWLLKNTERALLMRAKGRAKKRNLDFNLELSDIIIPEFCPALGIKLNTVMGQDVNASPSIDRIVPELGYVKGNILIVSSLANAIKFTATPDQILKVGIFYKNLQGSQVTLDHIGLSGNDTLLKLVA